MGAADEYLENYFRGLGASEAYARAHWEWLRGKGEGAAPNPRDCGVTSDKAQAIRIKLASAK
jgi:hypothetical protein